jgi:DNA-binding response OmpR family regulator
MMTILVVDANRSMAKRIKSYIEEHAPRVCVDIASNLPVMKHRLDTKRYNYIIADVMAAFDPDAMMHELNKSNIPVILWTLTPPNELQCRLSKSGNVCNVVRKPLGFSEELKEALKPVFA